MERRLILVKGAERPQPTRDERIAEEFRVLRRRVAELESMVVGWMTPEAA
jgi:hypothetical protein